MDRALRRRTLDVLRELNETRPRPRPPGTVTRIAQYELAYRMQISVPEVMDISREPKETLEDYGAVPGRPASPITACSPGVWPNRGCASCNCLTGLGFSRHQ